VEAATHVWERDEEHFAFPVPRLVMKFWRPGPVPGYIFENKKNYTAARDSARTALAAATPEGRAYATFWAGRMQFAVEYISAIESVHRGGDAEASHRPGQALEFAESALKMLARAIQTYAGVVRTQTDRGAIAVAVEYGYRPLEQKVVELRKQVGSSEKAGLVRR
jgi:hypothetical protein